MPSCIRAIGVVAVASLAISGLVSDASLGGPKTADDISTASAVTRSVSQDRHGPRFGTSVAVYPGETYRGAFERKRSTYGRLGIVRMFFPGMPQPWSAIRSNVGRTRLVVSFQAQPSEILSGRYDQQLRQWFADAPRHYFTRWSYWHEPEDDIERGAMQADAYRRAWRHIDALARSAHNPKLRASLILMCWTVDGSSGRDWRDYYPGDRIIDVMSFDCYSTFTPDGEYRPPRRQIGPAYRLAQRLDKSFGIAELGTALVRGDNGAGRARWLYRCASWLRNHHARFVSYWDTNDIALTDRASRRAWRDIVSRQWG